MRALRSAAQRARCAALWGWRFADYRGWWRFSVRRLTRWRAARRTLLCRGEQLESRRLLSLLGECDPTDFVEMGAVAGAASAAALYAPEYDPANIIVRFRPDGATVRAPEALASASGDREFSLVPGLRAVKLDAGASVEGALEAYRVRPDVLYAEPNYVQQASATPSEAGFADLWGLHNTGQSGGTPDADIDAPEAWDLATGNGTVVVGVIDTGVDYTHPDLAANMWINPGEIPGNARDDDGNGYIDDVHGYNFIGPGSGDPMDDQGHGTHVAGTIGGIGNNGQGVAGVSWNVKIMALKFLSAFGGTTADAIEAVNYATMMRNRGVNIRLTSNSWGGGGFSQALQDAIAASGAANMLFVAAAGNSNRNADTSPHYPSGYPLSNIISVAATDRNDAKASFSNYGANTVDLAAPGVAILSSMPGNSYAVKNGTSMAAPHVAGVAALAWSLAPQASYQQVRDAIFAGVDASSAFRSDGPTPVATGGRLNALKTLQLMGLHVIRSTPGADSSVAAPPTSYAINFSRAVDAASVQASDFTVDGLAADSVILNDSRHSATFAFNVSPVAAEGPHTMRIAAGSIVQEGSTTTNSDFTATFHYDLVPLAIVSTTPLAGETFVSPGPWQLDVTFNEALSPTAVTANDLALSGVAGASASDVTLINNNRTARFTIDDIAADGALNVRIAARAVADTFGNPNPAPFSASYPIDTVTLAFPRPLAKGPPGSLIYETATTGTIGTAGDGDSFTLAVDVGQTISVRVVPTDSTLAAVVELRDPANGLVGSAVSSAGTRAVLQTGAAGVSGTYQVTVRGDGMSTGGYSVTVALNAALELEAPGDASNDSIATAQDLSGSTVVLGSGAERVAVLGSIRESSRGAENFDSGTLPATITTYSSSSDGRIRIRAPGGGGNFSPYALFMDSTTSGNYALNEAIYRVNLSGLSKVRLSFTHMQVAGERHSLPTDFVGHANGDGVAISDDGNRWWTILNAPMDTVWVTESIDLAEAAEAAGMKLGADFQIKFQQYGDRPGPEGGRGYDDIRITVLDSRDTYHLALTAGDTVTVVTESLSSNITAFQLQDASGAFLGRGGVGPLVVRDLSNFVVTTTGSYFVIVVALPRSDYSLVVTRNATFKSEGNDTFAKAHPLASNAGALGGIGTSAATGEDWYALDVASTAIPIVLKTSTPGDGPGQLVNALNPRLELYNPAGTLVASGTAMPDGRNELIGHQPLVTGSYRVRVAAEGGTAGEYYLRFAPEVSTLAVSTDEDVPAAMTLSASDVPADVLGFTILTPPLHGALSLSGAVATYTPQADFNGVDSFVYVASDGQEVSEPAIVLLTISPVNDAPTFQMGPDIRVTDEGGPVEVSWAQAISPGPLESEQTHRFEVSNDNPGLFLVPPSIDAAGVLLFTPAPNTFGAATVSVVLRDSGGHVPRGVDVSELRTFTITTDKPHRWHNAATMASGAPGALDVNADGSISPVDAVLIINYLNARQSNEVAPDAPVGGPSGIGTATAFLDTGGGPGGTGDNNVSPLDAVLVINWLNARRTALPEVESAAGLPLADDGGIPAESGGARSSGLQELIALVAVDAAQANERRRHPVRRFA